MAIEDDSVSMHEIIVHSALFRYNSPQNPHPTERGKNATMSAARLHKRAVKKAAKKSAKVAAKKAAASEQKTTRRKIGQYQHQGKNAKRVNNPSVGIADMASDAQDPDTQYQFDPHLQPQLIWHGKRQRDQLDIPLQPLHIHERIDPRAIVRAVQKTNGNGHQLPFELPEENPPLERAVEFYQHSQNWANRLITGDSLHVMNSLLEKESMGGKIQCVYMDPPYGIKYGGNFQPFVHKRDVKDGSDPDFTTEPEMIRAFRDTWETGIHSYLSYLRDRLALCRELLADSGSCFVQISDENVHLVRNIMDEIFGAENFVSIIAYRTTAPLGTKFLTVNYDYLIWYARSKEEMKYRPLFEKKAVGRGTNYAWVDEAGKRRRMNAEEMDDPQNAPGKIFYPSDFASTGYTPTCTYEFEFEGTTVRAGKKSWRTHKQGLENLIRAKRIMLVGKRRRPTFIQYFDDHPVQQISNVWNDTRSAMNKRYVVETDDAVVQRCILMTTDPGDLVFDPTCGSGTTAYVAEQWGRRWITCDASRVALAIARQRLMTAHFPYYKLQDERAGVGGGFVCKTVPHITLKSVANQEYPERETLHDQPDKDNKKMRITGPFTVEAIPSQVTMQTVSPEEIRDGMEPETALDGAAVASRESSRHQIWRDELSANGARSTDGHVVRFSRVESCGGNLLHFEVETEGKNPEFGFVSFGPPHGAMSPAHVDRAIEEAGKRNPRPQLLVFAAFAFDPHAAKTLDEFNWRGGRIVKASMDTDLHVQDLKRKKRKDGDVAFWLMGRPDAELRRTNGDSDEWEVEVRGFDYYNPLQEGAKRLEAGGKEQIVMWMLDTDYDGRQLYPRQVFFPMGGKDEGWAKLGKNLRAELDAERMEKYQGTISLPFQLGEFRRAAVKIVDDRGIESLRVLEAPEQ